MNTESIRMTERLYGNALWGNARRRLPSGRMRGFSLIELMVALVVFAIIAVIAYPNYQNYVRKAHRTSAKTALLEIASRQERYYSTNNVYATSLTFLGYSATGVGVPSGSGPYYHVGLLAASATSYTIRAVPVGTQTQDTACGTFQLNSLGQKTISGTGTAGDCWQ